MIRELENTKLIRELNYLRSEFEYKSNLVKIYNIDFNGWIDKILSMNEELRSLYDEKRLKSNDEKINSQNSLEETESDNSNLKGIYREIVKLTHPDKIKNDSFHKIYNEANLAFKEGSSVDMMLICDRLGLPYEISDNDRELIEDEISNLKDRISMLESNYAYQWKLVDDEKSKNKIALSYIKSMIL